MLYLLPTTLHTFVSDTGTNINVFSTIPHCSARFPSPLLSLIPLPLPPSSPPLAPPQSTAGPPSLRPVSVLFHLACCYRGLDAGRLQLGSQSFSIYQSPRLPPPTHTLLASSSLSLYPTSASILTTLTSVSPDNTAIPHHTAAVRTSTLPSCLPPSISSTSISAENLAPEPRDEKEKEVGEERNIVAVEAFKLERQLELYYYLGLCHW